MKDIYPLGYNIKLYPVRYEINGSLGAKARSDVIS